MYPNQSLYNLTLKRGLSPLQPLPSMGAMSSSGPPHFNLPGKMTPEVEQLQGKAKFHDYIRLSAHMECFY